MKIINSVLSISAISVALMTTTYAGVSNDLKKSLADLPCDNVEYPVADSINAYSVNADTPHQLTQNMQTTLNTTSKKTETDSVSDSYSNKVSFSLGFEPKLSVGGAEGSTLKGSIAYEWGSSQTITKGNTSEFSSSDSRTLTPLGKDMTATPVFFKNQIWATWYKCDANTKQKKALSNTGVLKIDAVVKQGWVFTCPHRTNSVCDPKQDWKN